MPTGAPDEICVSPDRLNFKLVHRDSTLRYTVPTARGKEERREQRKGEEKTEEERAGGGWNWEGRRWEGRSGRQRGVEERR